MSMTPIATAYPSEGIPDELHAIVWGIHAVAMAVAMVGLVLRLQPGWRPRTRRRVAMSGLLLGLVPLVWNLRIYLMDYVPEEIDGTPASPPFWQELAIPSIPAICGVVLWLAAGKPRPPKDDRATVPRIFGES